MMRAFGSTGIVCTCGATDSCTGLSQLHVSGPGGDGVDWSLASAVPQRLQNASPAWVGVWQRVHMGDMDEGY